MSPVDVVLVLIDFGLVLWILQLKSRVSELEHELESQPPEKETISPDDLRRLRTSLTEVASELERYTESQIKRIHMQMEALHVLVDRLESHEKRQEAPPPPPEVHQTARVVPITSRQLGGSHKDKDRIIELHEQGWSLERIAEELRLTRSEVQLVVNLS